MSLLGVRLAKHLAETLDVDLDLVTDALNNALNNAEGLMCRNFRMHDIVSMNTDRRKRKDRFIIIDVQPHNGTGGCYWLMNVDLNAKHSNCSYTCNDSELILVKRGVPLGPGIAKRIEEFML